MTDNNHEEQVIWTAIMADDNNDTDTETLDFLEYRVESGYRTYGKMLTTHNGRNAILDLCEEIGDAVFYSYQARLEAEDEGDDLRAEAMFHISQAMISTLNILVPKLPKLPSTTTLHDD